MEYKPEHLEMGYELYLQQKGYGHGVAEYKQLRKEMLKNNCEATRIAYRNKVNELNTALQNEMAKSKSLGNLEDETALVTKEVGQRVKEEEAYEKGFGEKVPKGWTTDEAFRLKVAKEVFKDNPTETNAGNYLNSLYKGDMSGALSAEREERARAKHREAMEGFSQTSEEAIQKAQELQEKVERDEAERLERVKKEREQMNDRRLGRRADMKIPLSPRAQQEIDEAVKTASVRKTLEYLGDNSYGYNIND